MAKYISERAVVNVKLLDVEFSEDELEVFAACLDYVLNHCSDEIVEQICGADPDEVAGIRDDLMQILGFIEPETAEFIVPESG